MNMSDAKVAKRMGRVEQAIDKMFRGVQSTFDYAKLYSDTVSLVRERYGEKLYGRIKRCFRSHATQILLELRSSSDPEFLRVLLERWRTFRLNLRKSKDLLLFLDEHYVDKSTTHDRQILSVNDMGVDLFKRSVLFDVQSRVRRLMIEMIRRDRMSIERLDRFLLKNLSAMMVEIHKTEAYERIFETPLVEDAHRFFKAEAAEWFDDSTAVEYLQKVQLRLEEERRRAQWCFPPGTLTKLDQVVFEEMISTYKDQVVHKEGSGVLVMLRNQQVDNLKLVYRVFSLVARALEPTIAVVKAYIEREGLGVVQEYAAKSSPLQFVERIIQLRVYYEQLLHDAFSRDVHRRGYGSSHPAAVVKDKDFSKAVRDAFVVIVNTDSRFPEYMSLLIDHALKRGHTRATEGDVDRDTFFDNVIMTLHHVKDKDMFQVYYKIHLAKRLLSRSGGVSEDAEKALLSKLKTSFGYQFTSAFEGMHKDMKVSEQLGSDWRDHRVLLNTTPPTKPVEPGLPALDAVKLELAVNMLTVVYWPIQRTSACIVPDVVLARECRLFRDFYNSKHSGRIIQWQHQMGTADVRANGFAKKYEFTVNSYQMMVMLLFNDHATLQVGEMHRITQIPMKEMKKCIFQLCQPTERAQGKKRARLSKLLLKRSPGPSTLAGGGPRRSPITEETIVRPNERFTSKKIRVKILPVVKKEDDVARRQTMHKIDEERKWVIDAAIVRTMKMRKKFSHRMLIVEVIEQLRHRFTAQPDNIKRRIESLIEQEYIERDDKDRSVYKYRA